MTDMPNPATAERAANATDEVVRDERSMRIVEYAVALTALAAAVLIALR